MFWKREKKPLLREIAEGLNISASREKGNNAEDWELDHSEPDFQREEQPDVFEPRKPKNPEAGPGSRRKMLVDDFVVQRYGDQEDIYVAEPPSYTTPAGDNDPPPENRHPYLKTALPDQDEESDRAIPPAPPVTSQENIDTFNEKLRSLEHDRDALNRIAHQQEEMLSEWGRVSGRLDNLDRLTEDLGKLTPFLTKFYDLERKLHGVVKLEERLQYLESGLERIFPAIENIDDELRLLATAFKEGKTDRADGANPLPTADQVRELGGIIEEKMEAFSRLEEKMKALSGDIPDITFPEDRFDRLEQKIDEKLVAPSLMEDRFAAMEERMSAFSAVASAPELAGEQYNGLDRKLDGLLSLEGRLASLEEKISGLTGAIDTLHRMDSYLESVSGLRDRLDVFQTTLDRFPHLTQELEKLDEIDRKYQDVENRLEEASDMIRRDLNDLRESSEYQEKDKDDRQVIMVFDEDEWTEES